MAPRPRLSTRRSRASRPKRRSIWARYQAGGISLATDSTAAVFPLAETQTQMGSEFVGITILAVRGLFRVTINNDQAATGTVSGAAGMMVNQEQSLVTTGADDSIIEDERWDDFFWYQPFLLMNCPNIPQDTGGMIIPVESRSKRRLDEIGDNLEFRISNGPGGLSVNWAVNLSILVGLP